jgi:hypothetical protein
MLRRLVASVAFITMLPLIAAAQEGPGGASVAALDLFEQRIMPIFRSPQPSSCVQCHLASVDLKSYILPSHEKTFVSLRDQGLIDLQHPEKSKVLALIQMGEQDLDRGAKLIHQKTRQAEYDAFAAWIKSCCADERLRNLPPLEVRERAGPQRPDAVIRHNRKDRLLDSFVRNVWSQRMRCFPCHTPNEISESSDQHQKPRETHRQFVEQFGQRMNIFQATPEATLRQLIVSSRKPSPDRLPLINTQQPANSLLVLKPTAKVPPKDASGQFEKPTFVEPISHMGGLKMFVDDQSYKSFLAWIEDYARVAGDKYATGKDLPPDNWYPTKQVLRLADAPQSWPPARGVQMFVHAWNREQATWEPEPVAFTQAPVSPRQMVNGTLFLIAPKGGAPAWDSSGAALPAGKYLVKVYVDSQRRLAGDPALLLGPDEFYGQAEIEARWKEGFPQAEILSASRLAK